MSKLTFVILRSFGSVNSDSDQHFNYLQIRKENLIFDI